MIGTGLVIARDRQRLRQRKGLAALAEKAITCATAFQAAIVRSKRASTIRHGPRGIDEL